MMDPLDKTICDRKLIPPANGAQKAEQSIMLTIIGGNETDFGKHFILEKDADRARPRARPVDIAHHRRQDQQGPLRDHRDPQRQRASNRSASGPRLDQRHLCQRRGRGPGRLEGRRQDPGRGHGAAVELQRRDREGIPRQAVQFRRPRRADRAVQQALHGQRAGKLQPHRPAQRPGLQHHHDRHRRLQADQRPLRAPVRGRVPEAASPG